MRLHLLTRVDLTGESVHHLREAREADVYFDSVYGHAVKLEEHIDSLPNYAALKEEHDSLSSEFSKFHRAVDDVHDLIADELKKSKLDKQALQGALRKLAALL